MADMNAEVAVIEKLRKAAEEASAALEKLNGLAHAGIEIRICGDLVHVQVHPTLTDMDKAHIRAEASIRAAAVARGIGRHLV